MSFFSKFPKTEYDIFNRGVTDQITNIFRYVHVPIDQLDEVSAYKNYVIKDGARPDQVSLELYGTDRYYWTFFLINDHLKNGLGAWPLSDVEFERYMAEEYEGVVINTRAKYIRNSDDLLIRIEDSVSGRFQIGETVTGILSGATGTIVAKDPSYQQIVVQNVQGTFQKNELIRGNTTLDVITSFEVFPYQLAPRYYLDENGQISDNSLFIGTSDDGLFSGGKFFEQLTVVTNREFEEELNEKNARIRVVRPEIIDDFASRYEDLLNARNI